MPAQLLISPCNSFKTQVIFSLALLNALPPSKISQPSRMLASLFWHAAICPHFAQDYPLPRKHFLFPLVFSLLQFLLTSADWAGLCKKKPCRALVITWTWRFNPALKLAALHVCPWTQRPSPPAWCTAPGRVLHCCVCTQCWQITVSTWRDHHRTQCSSQLFLLLAWEAQSGQGSYGAINFKESQRLFIRSGSVTANICLDLPSQNVFWTDVRPYCIPVCWKTALKL